MTDTSLAEKGQITTSAAEVYDSRFVPALFGQFAPWLVDFAGVRAGNIVLDLATGTGAAALAASAKCATVTGLDVNAGMLTVARRKSDAVTWEEGDAADLPFADTTFDAALCQFGFMFFPDRACVLTEMLRVLKPNGTLAIAVFDRLDRSPVYRDLVPMLSRIVSPAAGDALTAPFVLGDIATLTHEIETAGGKDIRVETVTGTARHTSTDAWLDTEVGGWTISEMVSPAQLDALKSEARQSFAEYIAPDGTFSFPAPAHFIAARK